MSGERENGGPAFPTHKDISVIAEGMTLRDYFAGQAMAGMLAATCGEFDPKEASRIREVKARSSYAIADAMLAERSK